jgi:hypothetical protein
LVLAVETSRTATETVSHDGIRIERRVDLRGHGNAKISRHSDSSVCEYRLLSLWHRSRSQTIHSAPSFAFARSILSKPLAPHSKLQTSSRHIPHYQHSTSLTSELALTQKSWLLQAHSHPPPRAATHLRLRAPMPLGNGTSTLAFRSFAGHEAREAQRQACASD